MRSRLRLREDDGGFSTVGMVVALGLSLVLVFSGVRVYRVQTLSADVQDVADVAALAAENQVSMFVCTARICDAAVLSFSLAGIVCAALGVVVLCIPATSAYGDGLLEVAQKIFRIRDQFAERAAEGLEIYQKCLPFLAMSRACTVAMANNAADQASYIAVAVLSPWEGEPIGQVGDGQASSNAEDAVQEARDNAEEIRRRGEEAERIAKEAEELKLRAWLLDCGDEGRCLRERASHLAGLSGTANPRYASVDAWSFSVPLARCRAYYRARLAAERPSLWAGNPEAEADCALRMRIYRYAVEEFDRAYVRETDAGFDCFFPVLPRNLPELKQTPLYTERVYPMSYLSDGTVMMHAYAGCPGARGCGGMGSIALLEGMPRTVCPYCEFTPYSLASVCAATSVVNSGYEYYYRQIAALAQEYEKFRGEADAAFAPAKRTVSRVLEELGRILKSIGGTRLEVRPPGAYGAIAIVANVAQNPIGGIGRQPARGGPGADGIVLGVRAAVSAATLVEDDGEGAPSVITGLPAMLGLMGSDGNGLFGNGPGVASRVLGIALGLWNSLINVYNKGQRALEGAIEDALSGFSWHSSSGLGTWAAKKLRSVFRDLGLEAAPTWFLKPVTVNTALVAGADGSSFGSGFLAVKQTAQSVAAAGEWLGALQGILATGAGRPADGESLPRGGIVVEVTQHLLGADSPLTIVFTLQEDP
ncbi:MAG: molybdenum cofactor biosynthesis enzyme [Eggerthellaceae bacterium]|nr:molybdenum cofactor biosynthesis enzyme [Eggerthellaceae bacterium]